MPRAGDPVGNLTKDLLGRTSSEAQRTCSSHQDRKPSLSAGPPELRGNLGPVLSDVLKRSWKSLIYCDFWYFKHCTIPIRQACGQLDVKTLIKASLWWQPVLILRECSLLNIHDDTVLRSGISVFWCKKYQLRNYPHLDDLFVNTCQTEMIPKLAILHNKGFPCLHCRKAHFLILW